MSSLVSGGSEFNGGRYEAIPRGYDCGWSVHGSLPPFWDASGWGF